MTEIEYELRKHATDAWPHPDWATPFSTVYFLGSRRLFARNLPGAGGVEVWQLVQSRDGKPTERTLITSVAHVRELLTAKGITNGRDTKTTRGDAAAGDCRMGPATSGELS